MLPQRGLIIAGTLVGATLLTVYALVTGSPQLLVLLIAFPIAVFLVNHTPQTFIASIVLSASYLTLPGLPFKLNLYLLACLFSIGTLLASAIVNRRTLFSQPGAVWIGLLAIWMLAHAWVRGFGLRSMGGESWGGFSYITMLISCAYFIASGHITLDERQWWRALTWMCLLSAIPTAAQALYALTGGALHHVFYFVVPEFQVLEYMTAREAGSGLARLHQANSTSQFFFILAMLQLGTKRPGRRIALLVIASAVLAGLAGNRITLVFNMLLLCIYLFIVKRISLQRFLFHPATMLVGVAFSLMCAFAQHLPLTFQRVLAVIPFANVSWVAKTAASATIGWRFKVWEAALRQVPDYLMLGKGFAFSAEDVMTISARSLFMNDIDYVLASRNYHNGVIRVLLDLGPLGLLFVLGFIFLMIRRHARWLRTTWAIPLLGHMHGVSFAVFVATTIVYFLLAGGINHLATLFLWGMIMEGLVRVHQRATAKPPTPASQRPRYFLPS